MVAAVSHDSPRVAVIVVAAGSGVRLGQSIPKAFVELAGMTLLERAVGALGHLSQGVQVIVVVPADFEAQADDVAKRALSESDCIHLITVGGATRHESVQAGLSLLAPSVDTVLVHDAARSLTPGDVFERVIAGVATSGHGVIPTVPIADTIKTVSHSQVTGTVDRSTLVAVQTPQGFPRRDLEHAYAHAGGADFTDDAGVFSNAGLTVETCPGDANSFKITTPSDLTRANTLLLGVDGASLRTGTATDTHAFGEAMGLRLAGLDWPNEHVLSGHSDGDAVAHAIVDALLVAAGLGDIGGMVGIDDPAYAGASGEIFVREAVRGLAEAGFTAVNVTAQLIGNRPRFAARRLEAEQVLSGWVGAPVTLSATTTDGLGLTGEGRGISVIATALISHNA
ncbi:MAG: 2-C-methyl-D-erythritol 4-phosphate cytidylyltransferase [Actinobacteria bacterium]|nr:2-C-methyl-D-erythritol 4-phosphate cytidylyltransferase [Actinomycetota bacterium]